MMERAGDQQRVTFGHLGVEGQYKEKGCSRESFLRSTPRLFSLLDVMPSPLLLSDMIWFTAEVEEGFGCSWLKLLQRSVQQDDKNVRRVCKKTLLFSAVLLKTVAEISNLLAFIHKLFNICDHWVVFLVACRISKALLSAGVISEQGGTHKMRQITLKVIQIDNSMWQLQGWS